MWGQARVRNRVWGVESGMGMEVRQDQVLGLGGRDGIGSTCVEGGRVRDGVRSGRDECSSRSHGN